jgi:hypothetical protein
MGEPFLSFLTRWNQMILVLSGEPVPPPPAPALPGRVFRAPIPDGRDPLAEQWDREHGVVANGWEWQP